MGWIPQHWYTRAVVAALLGLGPGTGLGAAPGHAHGHSREAAGPVQGTLEIKAGGGEVKAVLTYANVSHRRVWLEKVEEGEAPMRPEFEIRTDGRQVSYVGPMAKRQPYTRADFFPLEPGQSHRREVRIDDRYDFPEGEHAYRATHTYLMWNDRTRQAVHRTLKPAAFTYAR
jgi:hypothetical protein